MRFWGVWKKLWVQAELIWGGANKFRATQIVKGSFS